jgi:hypothetical protein
VAKAIDLDTGIFYLGLYGDINTNVLVKYTRHGDISRISQRDELDKHSICAGLNFTVKLANCTNIILESTFVIGENCINNQISAKISLKFGKKIKYSCKKSIFFTIKMIYFFQK